MIISELSYLEVVAEASSIVGGETTVETMSRVEGSPGVTGRTCTTIGTTNIGEGKLLEPGQTHLNLPENIRSVYAPNLHYIWKAHSQ